MIEKRKPIQVFLYEDEKQNFQESVLKNRLKSQVVLEEMITFFMENVEFEDFIVQRILKKS